MFFTLIVDSRHLKPQKWLAISKATVNKTRRVGRLQSFLQCGMLWKLFAARKKEHESLIFAHHFLPFPKWFYLMFNDNKIYDSLILWAKDFLYIRSPSCFLYMNLLMPGRLPHEKLISNRIVHTIKFTMRVLKSLGIKICEKARRNDENVINLRASDKKLWKSLATLLSRFQLGFPKIILESSA